MGSKSSKKSLSDLKIKAAEVGVIGNELGIVSNQLQGAGNLIQAVGSAIQIAGNFTQAKGNALGVIGYEYDLLSSKIQLYIAIQEKKNSKDKKRIAVSL